MSLFQITVGQSDGVKAPTIPEIVRKIESEEHKYSKTVEQFGSGCAVARTRAARSRLGYGVA